MSSADEEPVQWENVVAAWNRLREARNSAAHETEVREALSVFNFAVDRYRTWIWNHRRLLKSGD